MSISNTRKLINNESKFREYNEAVQKGFDALQATATAQNWKEDVGLPDELYTFFCECSDETCKERITIKLSEYARIHRNRRRFTIVCGHESPQIESIVEHHDGYCTVEKPVTPPEHVTALRTTD